MCHENPTKKLELRRIILCLLCMVLACLSTQTVTLATNGASISIGNATAEPSEQVTIPIMLDANPGIAGLILIVEYDSSRLTLVNDSSVSQGTALRNLAYAGVDSNTYGNNPFRLAWLGVIMIHRQVFW